MKGGDGRDTFKFLSMNEMAKGAGADRISDFKHGQYDKIDLSTIDANVGTGANDQFVFIGQNSFSGAAGELRFSSGVLSGDVNGDRVSDFDIQVADVQKLMTDDFIL